MGEVARPQSQTRPRGLVLGKNSSCSGFHRSTEVLQLNSLLSRRRTESTSVTRQINPAECKAENHARAGDNYRQHPDVASAERDHREDRVERKDAPPDCRQPEMNLVKERLAPDLARRAFPRHLEGERKADKYCCPGDHREHTPYED